MKRAFPFNFDWSNKRLWALDLPTHEIRLDRLSWVLTTPVWSTIRGKDLRDVVPREVLGNPDKYPEHYQRMLDTDLEYPIDCIWMQGRYHILDGVHRLAKYTFEKRSMVKIRKVRRQHLEAIRIVGSDLLGSDLIPLNMEQQ